MAKDKNKKKVPFNVFRKGLAGALIGASLLAGGVSLAGCGQKGADGKDGTEWRAGTSYTEFADAKVGDFFIDTDDYILYQKAEDNSWVVVMENYGKPAQAPTFTIGEDGCWEVDGVSTGVSATGASGAKWHHGPAAPTTVGGILAADFKNSSYTFAPSSSDKS